MTTTKYDQVFDAIVNRGQELTAAQIKSRYKVANPHDIVYKIRQNGYKVSLNEYTDTKGRVKQKYSYSSKKNS